MDLACLGGWRGDRLLARRELDIRRERGGLGHNPYVVDQSEMDAMIAKYSTP